MTQKDIFGKRLNQLKMTLSEQTRKEKKKSSILINKMQ